MLVRNRRLKAILDFIRQGIFYTFQKLILGNYNLFKLLPNYAKVK